MAWCVTISLNICFPQMLDEVSQETIILVSYLQTWKHIINNVRNWVSCMGCVSKWATLWLAISLISVVFLSLHISFPPLEIQPEDRKLLLQSPYSLLVGVSARDSRNLPHPRSPVTSRNTPQWLQFFFPRCMHLTQSGKQNGHWRWIGGCKLSERGKEQYRDRDHIWKDEVRGSVWAFNPTNVLCWITDNHLL